jgi:co-chaperonin GroES (HSP10)
MSKTFVEPAGDAVLVVDIPQDSNIDGIMLPDNVRQLDMLVGLVIAVGPDAKHLTKPEDKVFYGPYAGKLVSVDGTQFRTIKQAHIELYLRTKAE